MHVVALPLGLFDARSFKKRISSERIRWDPIRSKTKDHIVDQIGIR